MKLLEEERRSFKEELTFSDSVWQPIRQSPHADIGASSTNGACQRGHSSDTTSPDFVGHGNTGEEHFKSRCVPVSSLKVQTNLSAA